MQGLLTFLGFMACILCASCASERSGTITLTVSASNVGREGALLRAQLGRFEETQPGVRVVLEETPDAADQRHQLYVQWLNAESERPDVLQLDVIWTPEFAAAGWLLPLSDELVTQGEFFPATLEANRFQGRLYALPWFVDVGMLYYRTDLLEAPPQNLEELAELARAEVAAGSVSYGLVWQNARYEGLITNYVEVLGGFGGWLQDPDGSLVLDSLPAKRALSFMQRLLREGVVPAEALGWQEEQTRFAFQNGQALFMRNWPYAYPLLQSHASRVRGKFDVMPVPGTPQGSPTATLGGAQLAVNRHTRHAAAARALVRFLTAPEQMRQRALLLGQLPPRPDLFDEPALSHAFGVPAASMRRIVASARARPPHPLYTELSGTLQIELHRALSGQVSAAAALASAQAKVEGMLQASGFSQTRSRPERAGAWWPWLAALGALGLVVVLWCWPRAGSSARQPGQAAGAWWMLSPAVVVVLSIALLPLGATFWQSLFIIDLRMPWNDSQAPTLDNYETLLNDSRLWGSLGRTLFFVTVSVSAELALGLMLALALHRQKERLGVLSSLILLPWAIPTVVAGLVFRFLFDGPDALANVLSQKGGLSTAPLAWLTEEALAWVPIILADVWKTTPFVTLLLLAALASIDRRLYEAAEVDGALGWHQFRYITLPQLKSTLLVVLLFRVLDALRVFDLIYVLTHGGPGTATEPLALYTFTTLFSHLKFGQGAALSMISVALAAGFALGIVALMRQERQR